MSRASKYADMIARNATRLVPTIIKHTSSSSALLQLHSDWLLRRKYSLCRSIVVNDACDDIDDSLVIDAADAADAAAVDGIVDVVGTIMFYANTREDLCWVLLQ